MSVIVFMSLCVCVNVCLCMCLHMYVCICMSSFVCFVACFPLVSTYQFVCGIFGHY